MSQFSQLALVINSAISKTATKQLKSCNPWHAKLCAKLDQLGR